MFELLCVWVGAFVSAAMSVQIPPTPVYTSILVYTLSILELSSPTREEKLEADHLQNLSLCAQFQNTQEWFQNY